MKSVYISKQKLEQLYCNDKLGPSKIAELYGIHRSAIHKKLVKFNIPRRSNTILSNKKELEDLYWGNNLSMNEIAIKFNTTSRLVNRRMMKFNILRRSGSESISMARKRDFTLYNEFVFNQNQQEIFDGLMLSDGFLHGDYHVHTNAQYTSNYLQPCKYKEFLNHIRCILPLGYSNNYIRETYEKGGFGNDKKYKTFRLRSLSSSTLLKERKRWYPNGKKIVPKDLVLTPKMLLYLFLGDGSFGGLGPRTTPEYTRSLSLHTQSFTKQENLFLMKQLLNFGIKSTLGRRYLNETQYFIRIRNKSVKTFFDLIGKCPVKCYEYKWGDFS